jgi:hypothetical protein
MGFSSNSLCFRAVGVCFLVLLAVLALTAARAAAGIVYSTPNGLYPLGATTPIYEGHVNGFGVSPSGEQVVFTPAISQSHEGDVMLTDIEGNSVETIAGSSDVERWWSEVRFAPNGEEIIGVVDGDIYAMDVDGDNLRRLVVGENRWPVMSKSGDLAFIDGEGNLMILEPSLGFSTPRVLVSASNFSGLGGSPPSFSPSGEEITVGNDVSSIRGFNVETGTKIFQFGSAGEVTEWETGNSILGAYESEIERYTFNGGSFPSEFQNVATTKNAQQVRVSQFAGEVTPPRAPIPDETLLQEFAPRLRYDAQEPYFATAAESITQGIGHDAETEDILYVPLLHRNGGEVLADPLFDYPSYSEEHGHTPLGHFGLSIENLGTYYSAGFTAPDSAGIAGSGDYIDEHNGTHLADFAANYESAAYGHVVHETAGSWLQYWFFYYYNNGIAGAGDHEGDWEMIQVHVSYETGLPNEVAFAEHGYLSSCEAGDWEPSNGSYPGGGPVVYVANGSHASYPEEGSWLTEVPGNLDTAYPNEEELPAVEPPVYNLDAGPGWLVWPGKWGASGSSPQGPAMHGEQWSEPSAWVGESQGLCTTLKQESLLRRSSQAAPWEGLDSSPLRITRAAFRGNRVVVRYQAARLTNPERGWPRLLLTVDARHDLMPPKTIVVAQVKRKGNVTLPFRLDRRKLWRVRASYLAPDRRSAVIVQSVASR